MNFDKRLLGELRAVRLTLALTVGLGLLAGILLVLQAYLISQTISRVFLDHDDLRAVGSLLVALLAVILVRALLVGISEITAHHTASHIKTDLRTRLFAHLTALGPAYARGERSGELANTAIKGIDELDAYFSQYIPQVALSALIPLTMLVFILPLDPLSAIVMLLTAPMIPVMMVLIGSLASAVTRQQWTTLSRMSAHFLDVLQGLTTLKIFGRSRDQITIIAQISDQFRDATMRVLRVAFLSALALEMLSTISTAIIAVEIGLRLLYSKMSFDEAFFILILAPEFYLPLRMLGARFHAGVSGATAAQRIYAILETPAPATGSESLPAQPFTVRFEDVMYAYDENRPALNGITFQMTSGQKIALVGASGAGKSTVIQLLLRFIDPVSGRITINGIPLLDIPVTSWRDQIAWVPQIPYLFHASAAANIRLARPDAPLDDVIRAAKIAHADDFIRTLPLEYDTIIGERGARLSGGQAQRIALARAFLKNAPLLVLDEATSGLDPETESLLQDSIRALMVDRTVLMIAHRLSTVMDADQIIVLDEGRIVETGTHAALLAQNATYARLIHA